MSDSLKKLMKEKNKPDAITPISGNQAPFGSLHDVEKGLVDIKDLLEYEFDTLLPSNTMRIFLSLAPKRSKKERSITHVDHSSELTTSTLTDEEMNAAFDQLLEEHPDIWAEAVATSQGSKSEAESTDCKMTPLERLEQENKKKVNQTTGSNTEPQKKVQW